MTRIGSCAAVAFVTVLGWAPMGRTEEAKVQVHADVVLMSNHGNVVDPSLASMKDTFSKEGFSFSSYKRLSSQRVVLSSRKASEISLPNQRKAILKLEGINDGVANIGVSVGAVNTTYTLGQVGSVFINFGHQNGGELVLVLSPLSGRKPRHAVQVRPVSKSKFWRAISAF